MRFLADENVSGIVIARLQDGAHDVERISKDRRGAPDEAVLAMAEADNRILITEDRDFGELVIRDRLPVAGILLLELDQLSNEAEDDRVLNVVEKLGEQISGALVVIEPGRTRIRPLPDRN